MASSPKGSGSTTSSSPDAIGEYREMVATNVRLQEIKQDLKFPLNVYFDRKVVYSRIVNSILKNSYTNFFDGHGSGNNNGDGNEGFEDIKVHFVLSEDELFNRPNSENILQHVQNSYPNHGNNNNKNYQTDFFNEDKHYSKIIEKIVKLTNIDHLFNYSRIADHDENSTTMTQGTNPYAYDRFYLEKISADLYNTVIVILFEFYTWCFKFANDFRDESAKQLQFSNNNFISFALLTKLHHKIFPLLVLYTLQDIRNIIAVLYKTYFVPFESRSLCHSPSSAPERKKHPFMKDLDIYIHVYRKQTLSAIIKLLKVIDYFQENMFGPLENGVFKIKSISLADIDEFCTKQTDTIHIITETLYTGLLLQ
jgi:hypothetical protein